MKIRQGDKVKIIAGENKGTVAEVLHVSNKDGLVWVEGVNMRTKHNKPNQQNTEGSISTYEAPIHISNVAFYDEASKNVSKIGYKGSKKDKVRIVKKTGEEVGKGKKVTNAIKKIVKGNKKVEATEDASAAKVEKAPAKKTTAKKTSTAKTSATKKAPAAKGGAK